jgi:DNA-binding transcriptional ArsR family regulator
MLDPHQLDKVAGVFRILAESTRLEILQQLMTTSRTVNEITTLLKAKQANISKQLGILYKAGLVSRVREGNFVRYGIADPMVSELCRIVCERVNDPKKNAAEVPRRQG